MLAELCLKKDLSLMLKEVLYRKETMKKEAAPKKEGRMMECVKLEINIIGCPFAYALLNIYNVWLKQKL